MQLAEVMELLLCEMWHFVRREERVVERPGLVEGLSYMTAVVLPQHTLTLAVEFGCMGSHQSKKQQP